MPRGVTFRGSVVGRAGPWTGSMGEGIAIGLNAARGAPVLGRPMARLLGALGEISLPRSHIVARIPVETLHHVDGTPGRPERVDRNGLEGRRSRNRRRGVDEHDPGSRDAARVTPGRLDLDALARSEPYAPTRRRQAGARTF